MCRTKAFLILSALLTGILLSQACVAAPLRIPSLKGIQVDGNPSDWGSSGFRINLFADHKWRSSASLSSKDTVRLAWDQRGLLVLFQVSDSTPYEDPGKTLWQGTSVELLMADHVGGQNSYHLLVSPGITPEQPNLRFFFYDYRKDSALKAIPLTQTSARKATKTGYIIEILLPWEDLNIKPKIGVQFALQVMINHLDYAGKSGTRMWYPKLGADEDTTRMYPILLSQVAGHDKSFLAFPDNERIWPEKIAVVGEAGLAGRKVTARSGSQVLSQGIMQPASGRSLASLSVPLAWSSQVEKPVNVVVEGEGEMPVTLADAFKNTQRFLRESSLVFSPFVFSGTAFPACDFENANQIHSNIGDYTITRRFFNANYEEVSTADKPGRYGAIVKITTSENGPSLERYVTLFRQKDSIDWGNTQLSGTLDLPEGMGVDNRVYKEQNKTIRDLAKWALLDNFSKYKDGAVVMAGLSETPVGSAQCTSRNGVQALDSRWWYGLRKKFNQDTLYQYSAFLPKDYAADSNKSWPLLIALHGHANKEYTAQQLLKESPYAPILEYTKDRYPMITVIPYCPVAQRWEQRWEGIMVKDLIDSVSRKYRVDPKRIYLTGLSMGGYGTFSVAAEYPDIFAAIAPICGGGDTEDAASYKHLPVWAFHGDIDDTVPMQESIQMVDAIRKVGGDAKLTIYPGVDHNAWQPTFANPEFYEWLLSHSK